MSRNTANRNSRPPPPPVTFRKEIKSVFSRTAVTKTVSIPLTAIGKNIHQTLTEILREKFEGRCSMEEGYVNPGSIRVKAFSSGLLRGCSSNMVEFEVKFECFVCFPVEGMLLECIIQFVTKAGIQAESSDTQQKSPFVVYLARDHHYDSDYFASLKVNDKIVVSVIGQRFELNDSQVHVIATIRPPRGARSAAIANRQDATSVAAAREPAAERLPKRYDLVVARYREAVDWVSEPPFAGFKCVIYNKGPELTPPSPNIPVVQLPNVGREGHTYLQHIVSNYDRLGDVTLFYPGSALDEKKRARAYAIARHVKGTGDSVFYCNFYPRSIKDQLGDFVMEGKWSGSNVENAAMAESTVEPAQYRPFGKWYEHFFGDVDVQQVAYNGIFAVSREHIHQHDRSRYEALLDAVSHSPNPEDGHFLERSWLAVFYKIPDKCIYDERKLYEATKGQKGGDDEATEAAEIEDL